MAKKRKRKYTRRPKEEPTITISVGQMMRYEYARGFVDGMAHKK